MESEKINKKTTHILAINDGKAGHVSQINGVCEAILEKTSANIINYSMPKCLWGFLPSFFSKYAFLIPLSIRISLNNLLLNISNNENVLIIAVGRRTLPASLYLKNMALKLGFKCKLIYLMPPAKNNKNIDLTFFHEYKGPSKHSSNKYLPILMAPHTLSAKKLAVAKDTWADKFQNLKKPITVVLVGGSAKNIEFNKKSADDLTNILTKLHGSYEGSFIIITSRRTNLDIEKYLKKSTTNLPSLFFGYHEYNKENPYLGALAWANNVIISGESISMISESCSLPSDVKVAIFFSKNFFSKRYIKFHQLLEDRKYVYSMDKLLKNNYTNEIRYSANFTEYVADVIIDQFIK